MINVALILPDTAYNVTELAQTTGLHPNHTRGFVAQLMHRPYHMALTHLVLTNEYYRRLYAEISRLGGYVILDNSLMEKGHEAMNIFDVLRAADQINAREIVLPDVFRDGPNTLRTADEVLHGFALDGVRGRYTFAVVAHGRDKREWLDCYKVLCNEYGSVGCIHIPKVMDTIWPGGRAALCAYLDATGQVARHKRYHLLGVWTDPIELAACSNFAWLRSCDTALPGQAALQRVGLNGLGLVGEQKPKRPDGYFDRYWDYNSFMLLEQNIRAIDGLARGESDL